jgi:hypothetical protein
MSDLVGEVELLPVLTLVSLSAEEVAADCCDCDCGCDECGCC